MNWFRSRLSWRIPGVYLALTLPVLCVLILPISSRQSADTRRVLEQRAAQKARRIGQLSRDADSPESLTASSKPVLGVDRDALWVLDSGGRALSQSLPPEVREVSDLLLHSVIRKAESADAGILSFADEQGAVYAWEAVSRPAAGDRWFIVVGSNTSVEDSLLKQWRRRLGMTVVAAWICGGICAAIASQLAVRPLRRLTHAIAASNRTQDRADGLIQLMDRSDEFGRLARCLRAHDVEQSDRLGSLMAAETAMRSAATQLRAVLQSMVEGVIAIDRDERIIFSNSVACRMINADPATVENRPAWEVIREPMLQEAIRETLFSGEDSSLELKLPRSDTRVSVVMTPVAGTSDDGTSGLVIVLHDVSELRRMEIMRRDLVNGVSHELKTPLTVIQACTDTLLGGAMDDSEAARRFLGQIEEQSERLLQLILGMLQLARVESGEIVFHPEPVPVHELVDQLLSSMRPVADGRQLTLRRSGRDELYVLADHRALQTVLSNLVDNAIKYSADGGLVDVELVQDETANAIVVQDEGVGIPERDRDRVFERFYRVDRDRNRDRGGTGLGLAIVKHLCGTMQAEIDLKSRVGKGTEITVRFPIDD